MEENDNLITFNEGLLLVFESNDRWKSFLFGIFWKFLIIIDSFCLNLIFFGIIL
jgi:hypothetical protein